MTRRIDPRVIAVYGRLWRYVLPHKAMGIVAVIAMAATAGIEAAMVMLVEPLMDETLVEIVEIPVQVIKCLAEVIQPSL